MATAGVFLGPVASCFGTSFHNTMSPLIWIEMMLILSQASGTSGVDWKADYPKVVFTNKGDDVTIPCNFTYPPSPSKETIQAYWKRLGNTKLNINDNDKNEFLYHPNNTFVIKSFQNRTNMTGNVTKGNCSLNIKRIEEGDMGPSYYLRIATGANNFSFINDLVYINVSGTSGTISIIPMDKSNTGELFSLEFSRTHRILTGWFTLEITSEPDTVDNSNNNVFVKVKRWAEVVLSPSQLIPRLQSH
ncbi:unnamed protein product [Oncorhynchus mykiss]|uniref:Immunoglobulin V-set domain-containing protein n=1 Tax=Oncorhynchus mykiss TaxID=8022 RepID=A0A060ZA89_ONCMY|nr:unnamed protein product [Oncorhynchus mykiss]